MYFIITNICLWIIILHVFKKFIYITRNPQGKISYVPSYTLMLLRHALFENIAKIFAKIFAKMFAKMTNELNANKKSI